MYKHFSLAVLIVVTVLQPWSLAELREWSFAKGSQPVEAEFVGIGDKGAQLRKADGKVVAVALLRLSEKDQLFLLAKIVEHLGRLVTEAHTNLEKSLAEAKSRHIAEIRLQPDRIAAANTMLELAVKATQQLDANPDLAAVTNKLGDLQVTMTRSNARQVVADAQKFVRQAKMDPRSRHKRELREFDKLATQIRKLDSTLKEKTDSMLAIKQDSEKAAELRKLHTMVTGSVKRINTQFAKIQDVPSVNRKPLVEIQTLVDHFQGRRHEAPHLEEGPIADQSNMPDEIQVLGHFYENPLGRKSATPVFGVVLSLPSERFKGVYDPTRFTLILANGKRITAKAFMYTSLYGEGTITDNEAVWGRIEFAPCWKLAPSARKPPYLIQFDQNPPMPVPDQQVPVPAAPFDLP